MWHQLLIAAPLIVAQIALTFVVALWAASGMKKETDQCSE